MHIPASRKSTTAYVEALLGLVTRAVMRAVTRVVTRVVTRSRRSTTAFVEALLSEQATLAFPLPPSLPLTNWVFFFFFFITLGLEMSDTKVYEP